MSTRTQTKQVRHVVLAGSLEEFCGLRCNAVQADIFSDVSEDSTAAVFRVCKE
jgi:hypothetical protein